MSHEVSKDTPHWYGYHELQESICLDYHEAGFDVIAQDYTIVSQYGTHVDVPAHFVPDGRTLEQVPAESMLLPLCVIDVSEKVKANPDYAMTVEDIEAWEAVYGQIPAGSFVGMRSDWSKRSEMNNYDADGNPHYPGWAGSASATCCSRISSRSS